MGLLDFVKSFGLFKVKVGERTLGEGEVLLSNETEDMVISSSHNVIKIVEHTVVNELKGVIGKKKKKRVAFNNGLSYVKKVRGSFSIASSERNPATACKTLDAIQNLVTQSAFGWLLEEIHVTWAKLENKQTTQQLYTNSHDENAYSVWRRRHNSWRRRQDLQETASGRSRLKRNPRSFDVAMSSGLLQRRRGLFFCIYSCILGFLGVKLLGSEP
ncbi:hypothetical protein Tco_0649934 [Tanacetum coccineum]